MGSKATALLFDLIVDNTFADKDQDHIKTIILNVSTIPDRTGYLLGEIEENPMIQIKKALEELNQLGVKNILIPCNTSHYFYDQMQKISTASIINMPQNALAYIHRLSPNGTVCILGTLGTSKFKIYDRYNTYGSTIIYPDDADVEEICNIIYTMKKSTGNVAEQSQRLRNKMFKILDKHDQEVIFVLACTELSILDKSYFKGLMVVDALELCALTAICRSGKKLISNRLGYDYNIVERI